MSMVLTLTAAAVVAGMSLTEMSVAVLIGCAEEDEQFVDGLETIFTDSKLLQKTLSEMDCHMKVVSDDEIYVNTACGDLCYKRENSSMPFKLFLDGVMDQKGLINNIKSFEVDYGRNIQDYTYHHIKENLAPGMKIENEYFEDDDLYITINVE